LDALFPVSGRDEPGLEALHDTRFAAYELGFSFADIARLEGADETSVRRSIHYRLMRMTGVDCIKARQLHAANRAYLLQEDKYFAALDQLMEDPAWQARSQGMRHFRVTAGIDGPSAPVQVNVSQRTAVVTKGDTPQSFEALLTRVRAAVTAGNQRQRQTDSLRFRNTILGATAAVGSDED